MKQVLSLLVAYIFLQTQIWAIGGGPSSAGVTAASLIGDYAGALLPSSDSSTDPTSTIQSNGLGLFTLTLPESGLGTGDFVYFSEGRTFTGTITGLADPQKQKFLGLVSGQFDIVVDSIVITDQLFGDASLNQTVPGGFANGTIEAKFKSGGAPIPGSTSALRMKGEAQMEISELSTETVTDDNGTPGDTSDDVTTQSRSITTTSSLTLIVDGFQQTSSAGAGGGTTATATGT